ncbi:unnamed protein product [Bursaphelenchus okinawaensis]|uniref:Uncharacterized protein n=1 Tax=Bursaphelenchus okinawaensis TaxID=465554 RepID=A0A811KIC7_9BILA|nr:unnamed protein product [Bursaphelenchus okinawaensis]CAG9103548.1 unnamed protein product [Bursaphelenchus okinawaensis]
MIESKVIIEVLKVFKKIGISDWHELYLQQCKSKEQVVALCMDLCSCNVVESKTFRSLIKQVLTILKLSVDGLLSILDECLLNDSYRPGFVVMPVVINRSPSTIWDVERTTKIVNWINNGAKRGAFIKHLCDKPCESVLKHILGVDDGKEILTKALISSKVSDTVECWRGGLSVLKDKRKTELVQLFNDVIPDSHIISNIGDSSKDKTSEDCENLCENEESIEQLSLLMKNLTNAKDVSILTMADIMETLEYEEERNGKFEMPRDKINKFYENVKNCVDTLAKESNLEALKSVINIVLNTHSKKLIDMGNAALLKISKSLQGDSDVKTLIAQYVEKILQSEFLLKLRPYALSTILVTLLQSGHLNIDTIIKHFLAQVNSDSKPITWFNDSTLSRVFEVRTVQMDYNKTLKLFYERRAYSYVRCFYQISSAVFSNGHVSLSYFYYVDSELLEHLLTLLDDILSNPINYKALEKVQSVLLVLESIQVFELRNSPSIDHITRYRELLSLKLPLLLEYIPDWSFKARILKVIHGLCC